MTTLRGRSGTRGGYVQPTGPNPRPAQPMQGVIVIYCGGGGVCPLVLVLVINRTGMATSRAETAMECARLNETGSCPPSALVGNQTPIRDMIHSADKFSC
jgi:hypothetical protein